VDTQAAFDEALRQTTSSHWAPDKVHPNGPGHAIIAQAFLRTLGFELFEEEGAGR
jgi:lysophospholipase L1-like esterase